MRATPVSSIHTHGGDHGLAGYTTINYQEWRACFLSLFSYSGCDAGAFAAVIEHDWETMEQQLAYCKKYDSCRRRRWTHRRRRRRVIIAAAVAT